MTTIPTIKHTLKRNMLLPKGKLLKPAAFANYLQKSSSFANGNYIAGSFYIYQPEIGYYKQYTPRDVERAVLEVVQTIGLIKHVSKGFIQETTWFLKSLLGSEEPFRYDLIAFNNGTLNIKEMKLGQWSPDLFCTSKLCVDFVPGQKPEVFLEFLEQNFEKF